MPKISDIEETPNPNAVKFILREPVSHGRLTLILLARKPRMILSPKHCLMLVTWSRSSTWTA